MSCGLRYKDKVTIVTGGSRGIGKGISKVFVEHGSKVVFCSNEEKEGKETEKELNSIGTGEATFIFTDVTDEESVKAFVEAVYKKYGKIDCVINNAGIHYPHKYIDGYSGEDFVNLFKVNVLGYFLVSKYALPFLRKTHGNIIAISSITAYGAGMDCIYPATKAAIKGLMNSLATDEARYQVRVNTVSPGTISTPLVDQVLGGKVDTEKAKKAIGDLHLLGRLGTVEEVGLACLFLAADGTFCTGEDLKVTGGIEVNFSVKNPLTGVPYPSQYVDTLTDSFGSGY